MPRPRLRAFLLIAGAGAAVALVDLLGTAGAAAGLGAMIAGTVLSAPGAPEPGTPSVNWWLFLAAGTALAMIGVPLGLVLETPGGLLTAIGATAVVVGVALGYP